MVSCDDESTRGILGAGQKVVNAENRSHLNRETVADDDTRAALAANNRAFQIGRPARVGPGSRHEQIGNRAPMHRSTEFRPRPEGQDGMLNLVLPQFVEMTAWLQEIQRTKKRRNMPFKIRGRLAGLDPYDGEQTSVRGS